MSGIRMWKRFRSGVHFRLQVPLVFAIIGLSNEYTITGWFRVVRECVGLHCPQCSFTDNPILATNFTIVESQLSYP